MKKSTRRRPEVEPLETLLLLSTLAPGKAAAPAAPVQLSGTVTLKGQKAGALPGVLVGTTVLSGSANLGKFGKTVVLVEDADIAGETLVGLANKHGYAALVADVALPAKGASTAGPYQLFDAEEGNFAQEINPTGTVTISDLVGKGGKTSEVLKLS